MSAAASRELSFSLAPQGDKSILEILRGVAPEYLSAPCGGNGSCGKCLVPVWGPVRSLNDGAVSRLEGQRIKACAHAPAGDCLVRLPRRDTAIITDPAGETLLRGGGEGLGLAVDLGSTGVEAVLVELCEGRSLAAVKERNAQQSYGADVLSRIEYGSRGGLDELCACLARQLDAMADKLCGSAGRARRDIVRISLSGNTVMEHFAAALDPSAIARPPFEPQCLFGAEFCVSGPLKKLFSAAEIYFAPCVSGYVGGDVSAGLAAVGGSEAEGLVLYMDIGTNGELALGSAGGYLCCAAAAGPAFEGTELSCGMSGGPGAIDRVWAEGEDIAFHVIGEQAPRGICGSGVIEAVAALLELGVIGKTGRFAKKEALPEKLAGRLGLAEGKKAFFFSPEVWLSVDDIRDVQLAKAAIRAGAERLLSATGKESGDLDRLIIAGGFGAHIDAAKAMDIGLLPRLPREKISYAGNASLRGAIMGLEAGGRQQAQKAASLCRYLDLSSDPDFPALYLANINFN